MVQTWRAESTTGWKQAVTTAKKATFFFPFVQFLEHFYSIQLAVNAGIVISISIVHRGTGYEILQTSMAI